ncbi:MAG: aspartate/glutamate racemase family protein [Polaromonas sp.]|nr:aspartate/glutamate racemase family protein [Polaromonas sp.]
MSPDSTPSVISDTTPDANPGVISVPDVKASVAAGFLGVVMLDTRFPRLPGDIGHPDAFGVPTSLRVVKGAWPDKVVQSGAGLRAGRVVPAFVFVVRAMERDGAKAITTSCGFLVLLQKELQAAVKVPVVTSSLLQLPGLLAAQLKVGVLTISGGKLGVEHLRAAGVPRDRLKDVVVQGVDPKGEFATAILGNQLYMDVIQASAEVVAAAVALKKREPSLQHLVLECTNMPPYRDAIEAATGMKTWALTDDERLTSPWRPALVS